MKTGRFFVVAWLAFALFRPDLAADPADSPTPGPGFAADRYAALWTKSPFAIATPDAPADSQDFQLVGLAQFDGVAYVSLIDKQTQEHFVLSSVKPAKNLTLLSIAHGTSGASAVILRNGESITLRQEDAAIPAAAAPPKSDRLLPQANPAVGGVAAPVRRPWARIHRPPVIIPPRPVQ